MILGCSGNNDKNSEASFRVRQDIEFERVSGELLISRPNHIFEYKDWIVLIAFAGNGQDTFYLYDKSTGDLLKSGIKYANGPKEVSGGITNVSLQDGVLSYRDMQSGDHLFFSIEDYLENGADAVQEGSEVVYSWINTVEEAGDKQILFGNKGYLSRDTVSVPRITVIDGSGNSEYYDTNTIDDSAVRFWTYMQPYTTVSPDQSKLAVASGLGAILETFSISSGIKNITTRRFFEPEIIVANGTYDFTDNAILGFNDLCSTDDWIIASFDFVNKYKEREGLPESAKAPSFTDIVTFDWTGKPDGLYHSTSKIEKLCAEQETDTVYAVIQDSNGSYSIARAKINL